MAPFHKESQDISLGETEHATDVRSLTYADETKLTNPEHTPEKVVVSLEPTLAKKRLFSESDQYRTPLEEVVPVSLESIHALLGLRSTRAKDTRRSPQPQKPRSCAKKRAKATKPEPESHEKKVTIAGPPKKTVTPANPPTRVPEVALQWQRASAPAPSPIMMTQQQPTLYAAPLQGMHFMERPLSSYIQAFPQQPVHFGRQPFPPQVQYVPAPMNMMPPRYLYPQQMVRGVQGMTRPMGYGMFF